MQNTTKMDTSLLHSDLRLVPRFGYDLRPAIPALLYLFSYAVVTWLANHFGLANILGEFGLSAGLNLGLLLAYGLWYTPVVIAAIVAHCFWFYSFPFSIPFAALFCVSLSAIEVGSAMILRHCISGHSVTLKKGMDVALFIATGTIASAALATATILHRLFENPIQWMMLSQDFQVSIIGFATGIFLITPLLVIHAGPRLQMALFGGKTDKRSLSQSIQPLRMDRQGTLFALSFLCLVSVSLWIIFSGKTPEKLYIYFLISAPLIWVAIRRGLGGLSIAAPVIGVACIGSLLRMGASTDVTTPLLGIVLAGSVNAYMIAVGVTRTQAVEWEMERRNAILDAVSYAARQFLGNTGWETGVQEVVRRLGEATSVTRVFLIDNRTPNLGGQVGDSCRYEWENLGQSAEESDRRVLNVLRGQMLESMTDQLSTGQPVVYRTKNIERKKREILETLSIQSGVIVPMFVDGQWWGCIGLEQCFVDRDWPESEIDGLTMAGQILGTLIASVRVEQQFRQLTGNIQAVFWISASDGKTKQYVSPGYEEIWGRPCASLQRNPASWIQAIHPEDRDRITEALIRQVWNEFDVEYRVERPDGSMRWVHDRAFPVRDQSGKVDRIVGIAEDITKQKKTEGNLRAATVMLSSLIDHLHSGVVVEDEARKITHVNQSFNDLFKFPIAPESMFGVDSRLLFAQTPQFAERIEKIIRTGNPVLGEEIDWQGKIYLRNYVPLSINENTHYHLWQYQDVTQSRQAEEQIKSSLKEKEVLLKEIHHRVKNNLQIISSLLNLQSAEIEDPKASQKFRESQDRVKAMALIHERLYQSSDLAKIDFSGYVRSLTGHLLRSYRINASSIRLNVEVESVPMNLDIAIPCGLIINELVSNAFKYAFPESERGTIDVCFSNENDGKLRLVVQDNGVGFPEDKNPEETDSLGLKLVRSLTEQLSGTLKYRNRNGLVCEITIPYLKA